jgi:hypothetical protein
MVDSLGLMAAAALLQPTACGALKTISDRADFLGALERWREAGEAPARIVATRAPAAAGRRLQETAPPGQDRR